MLSQTVSTTLLQPQEKISVPAEVNNDAYIPNYNESDYSDFLYLAPPISAEFLPLEPEATDEAAALHIKKAKTRPAETHNTGTTPPPVTPAERYPSEEKDYIEATFLPVGEKTPAPEKIQGAADRRERRPSFVEVPPVKVHHEHDKHKDASKQKRHSHSSQDSEPMNWWPENETTAQHEWVDEDDDEGDVIEEEVWSEAFYE